MVPRVLMIGAWRPDEHWRFLSDGFVYAGCSVVRVGPQLFEGFPNDVLPSAYTFGLFDKGINGYPAAFSFKRILDECRTREWRPDLCIYQPLADPEIAPTDEMPRAVEFVTYYREVDRAPYDLKTWDPKIMLDCRAEAVEILTRHGFDYSIPRLWF